jgi:hypothetical protein
LEKGGGIMLRNKTKNDETYPVETNLTERQKNMVLSGGLINFVREKRKES